MYNEQKSTAPRQQARQRQMTKAGETWNAYKKNDVSREPQPAKQTRSVFASVNGYAQAEIITVHKRG